MTKENVLKIAPDVEEMKTGMETDNRVKVAKGLRMALADTYVMMVKTQTFHWNVVGPAFFGLHKLTEEHYRDLFEAIDTLGERIRTLGFPAPTNISEISNYSSVNDGWSAKTTEGMIAELVDSHEAVSRQMRDLIAITEDAGDSVTTDTLTARLRFHEEAIWMLKSVIAGREGTEEPDATATAE